MGLRIRLRIVLHECPASMPCNNIGLLNLYLSKTLPMYVLSEKC